MPLSYSQLHTYRRCPRQYEYAHVRKLSRPISRGEAFGAAIHNALKKCGDLELRRAVGCERLAMSGAQIPLFAEQDDSTHSPPELTTQSLMDIWHGCIAPDAYRTKMEADHARVSGEALLAHFYDWWSAAPRAVLAVERGFSIDIDCERFTGRFDRVERTERGIVIIDFKTSAVRSPEEADADLQLSLYALACPEVFGEPCAELLLLFLGEDGVVEVRTERSPAQLRDARTQMHSLAERMASGDYHPTPSVDVCKRCPYRNVCDAAAV